MDTKKEMKKTRPMRVFIAVPSYWPSQDGVANITGYLAEGLARRGHEVLVFTSAGNGGLQELPYQERHAGVLIERMRVFVRWPLILRGRDRKSTKRFYRRRIASFAPDVLIVVCSQTWTMDWLHSGLDKIKCPKVFYSHGYSNLKETYHIGEMLRKRNVLGAAEQYLCKRYYKNLYLDISKYDLAIYLSKQSNAAEYAREHMLTNGKVLENAIDDAFFSGDMKHEYSIEQGNKIRFLFVANYGENKNQEMLIRAYAKAGIDKSELIFAGFEKNPYYEKLEKLSEECLKNQGKKKIVLNAHLKREEILDLYRTADVFVCSSKSETWSIVAHEAAAAAMPIISTDVGVYGEIEGAFIVQNEEEMQEAMEKLYYSFEERKRRGEAAYRWLCTKGCRIEDKVDWLEKELLALRERRKEVGEN